MKKQQTVLRPVFVAACFAASAIAAPQANTPATPDIPKWESVSIKPCINPPAPPPPSAQRREGEGEGTAPPPPTDRITLTCVTLERQITLAYSITPDGHGDGAKLSTTFDEGFPDWIKSERYTIEAKAQGNPGIAMMLGPMMRTLLEDRFKLKVHEETREGKAYILTAAKGGPKMKVMQPGYCEPRNVHIPAPEYNRCPYTSENDGNMGFDAWMNMDNLAILLTGGNHSPESPLDAVPVIDKTGLASVYHIHIEYSPRTHKPSAPPAPSLVAALGKVGLKLEPGTGPQHFLVFDHAERPTEN
jgi:uncharacterized protein (TIGR03435 family)